MSIHVSLYVYAMYVQRCLLRPREHVRSLRAGGSGGRELPCGSWALDLSPLQEQQELCTAEPSLWVLGKHSQAISTDTNLALHHMLF